MSNFIPKSKVNAEIVQQEKRRDYLEKQAEVKQVLTDIETSLLAPVGEAFDKLRGVGLTKKHTVRAMLKLIRMMLFVKENQK